MLVRRQSSPLKIVAYEWLPSLNYTGVGNVDDIEYVDNLEAWYDWEDDTEQILAKYRQETYE